MGHVEMHARNYNCTVGNTHGDELIYLFSTNVFNLTPMDWEIARVMSNLWANFVIYG